MRVCSPRHTSVLARASLRQGPPPPTVNPLGDVAVRGVGRGLSKLWESFTNPKEDSKAQAKSRQSAEEAKRAANDAAVAAAEAEEDAAAAVEAALLGDSAAASRAVAAAQHAADDAVAAATHAQDAADAAVAVSAGGREDAEARALAGASLSAAAAAEEAAEDAIEAAAMAEAVQEVRGVAPPASDEWETAPVRGVGEYVRDAHTFLTASTTGRGVLALVAAFLAGTFAVALYRTAQHYSSGGARRRRTVDRNRRLVDELSALLPAAREKLTPAVVRRIRSATGFTPVEIFRKYLWFLLRERPFDQDAVNDMVALKAAAGLDDAAVAEALRERSQRIYDKYGTLMLSFEGMTPQGVERKAACQALFSKLLYLTECEALLAQGSDAFKAADLHTIFGATDEDVDKLRITALVDMDVERLEKLMGRGAPSGGSAGSPASSRDAGAPPAAGQGGGDGDGAQKPPGL